MRSTKELAVRGEPSDLERWLTQVEAHLRDGWKRDRQAEERLGQRGVLGPWDVCFSCSAKADRPAAGLWVHPRGPNELSVSNVIPRDRSHLSEEENSRLLEEFEHEFLRPAASEVGVAAEVIEHRPTLEDELSSEAVRLLRAFSASANRAGLHPNDRRHWNAFLVRAHQDESYFAAALLDEWLQREGWPEDTRSQLVGEYEAAKSLLAVYDEEAQRR